MKETVECLPSLAVGLETVGTLGFEWRLRHDLSPIDTSQVAGVFGGDEAVCAKDIEPAVVVEIGKGGAPTPAGHGGLGLGGDVDKASLSVGGEEGVSAGHAAEGALGFLITVELFQEATLGGDAASGAGEHVGNVEIHPAVAVEVAPIRGHAGGGVFNPELIRDVDEEGELSVFGALVLIEAIAAEVVGEIEVEIAVLIVVFPGSCEREAGVVLVEAGLFGDVFEGPIALVSPENVRPAVVGVVEGDGLGEGSGTGFCFGGVVTADVDVEEAVLVKVGGG